jgi:NAD(P)-dependent dehydrogenase (short-subunit alcohol dehydrogenase family)
MFSLLNKIALITGAATGLGQAIAVALAEAGADVAITDRQLDRLAETESLLRPFNRRNYRSVLDVRDLDQIPRAVVEVENALGHIDILVNNAGINRPSPGLEVTSSEWEDHFNTNVRGGFFLAQTVAKGMIARKWGRVIFISSQSGLIGIPGQPVYCATKGAVIQLVRTLGVEWAKFGITVNSIAPTFVETNLTRQRLQNPEFRQFVLNKIPCGQLATPQQIAAAAVYLASDEAAMVNCETHCVDGGWTAW